jgi:hypothetical protein
MGFRAGQGSSRTGERKKGKQRVELLRHWIYGGKDCGMGLKGMERTEKDEQVQTSSNSSGNFWVGDGLPVFANPHFSRMAAEQRMCINFHFLSHLMR